MHSIQHTNGREKYSSTKERAQYKSIVEHRDYALIHRGDTEENDGREVKLVSLRSVKGFRKIFVL